MKLHYILLCNLKHKRRILMQRIRVIILLLSLCVLSCGQDRVITPDKYGMRKRRSFPTITPDVKVKSGNSGLTSDAHVEVIERVNTRTKRMPQTPKRAYARFKRSYDKLKRFYNRRPKNFNVSLFDSIRKKFGVDERQGFKDSVYESLNGDIISLNNLEKIVMLTKGSGDAYSVALNSRPLLIKLCGIVGRSIFTIMNETGAILSKDNLVLLQGSQDVDGINNLGNKIDDIREKWREMVKLLQNIINNAARFATQEDVIQTLQPIIDLDTLRGDQESNSKLCSIKNELIDLYYQIEEQVRKLRLGLVKLN
ncbi:Hypothetical protein BCD_1355 (plasmid) [Borrelia crocidurae DOU]|uniref:Uncharacterized protein n=2 Tax=Borrelia crocidurae TaxID=29520 RepID=W5SQU1_9SPIR|nr:Hypothetical protein BCD_1355 [Borrelia crocidurae DOU]